MEEKEIWKEKANNDLSTLEDKKAAIRFLYIFPGNLEEKMEKRKWKVLKAGEGGMKKRSNKTQIGREVNKEQYNQRTEEEGW